MSLLKRWVSMAAVFLLALLGSDLATPAVLAELAEAEPDSISSFKALIASFGLSVFLVLFSADALLAAITFPLFSSLFLTIFSIFSLLMGLMVGFASGELSAIIMSISFL